MHDIKSIRDNPQAFDAALTRRRIAVADPVSASHIIHLDSSRRLAQTKLQEMQEKRNEISREIGVLMGSGDKEAAEKLKSEVATMKAEMQIMEEEERVFEAQLDDLLASLPNILDDDVPDGTDEASNVELRRHGQPTALDFKPKDHVALGTALAMMDFETAAKMSGARFVILKGGLARMERALAAFMLDLHTREFDYTEISPPTLVRDEALFGTGQLPKFGDDLFRTKGDHWLIPTAEVPLTNMVSGEILDGETLPLRFTAHTQCFRSEAGAAGKDTHGMIRQHQFGKVELVSIAHPDHSADEHERMTDCAEEVLKRLELPYKVMTLCSGDTGFSARKTYDIEVWMPSQDCYREISSCSNCGDFQARRMKARFRTVGEKGNRFVHTLNGSGLAIGRTLIAIMENYQQADGSITVPHALRPFMDGIEALTS